MVVISKQNLDDSLNLALNIGQANLFFPETIAQAAFLNLLNQPTLDSVESSTESDTEEEEVDTKATAQRKAERLKKWQIKKDNLKDQKKKRNQYNYKKSSTEKGKGKEKGKPKVTNVHLINTIEEKEKGEEPLISLEIDSPDELISVESEKIREYLESIADLFDEEVVEEVARETGFVKRKSKLTGQLFLTVFTFGMNIYGTPSLNQLIGLLDEIAGVEMSRQAFFQRIKEEAVDFLSYMLSLGIQVVAPSELNLQVSDVFSRIMITDSTAFQLPEELAQYFRGSGGSASAAGVKIQFAYDLKSSQFLCLIQDGTTPDNCYDNSFVQDVQEGDLHIRDLGSYNTQVFIDIDAANAFFMSRLKSDAVVYIKNDENQLVNFHLDHYLEPLERNLVEIQVYLKKDKQSIPVRLVIQKVPQEVKESRFRKIKKSNQKKGRTTSQRTIIRQGFNLYITNMPQKMVKLSQEKYQSLAEKFPFEAQLLEKYTKKQEKSVYINLAKVSEAIISKLSDWFMLNLQLQLEVILAPELFYDLYRIRWQIELIFKNWKSHFSLDQMRVKNNEYFVKCMIYAKLMYIFIATKITFVAKSLLWSQEEKEISELQAGQHFRVISYRWLILAIDSPSAVVPMLLRCLRFLMRRCIKSKKKGASLPLELLAAI